MRTKFYFDGIDGSNQTNTPVATMGFGAREDADATRQAQQQLANDAPVDVNFNALVTREQALTFTTAGQMHVSNQDMRQKLQDRILSKLPT